MGETEGTVSLEIWEISDIILFAGNQGEEKAFLKIIEEAERVYIDAEGKRRKVSYFLWREQEDYGLTVGEPEGQMETVRDVTRSEAKAKHLFQLLYRHLVTGVTLRDVLEDIL